MRKVRSICVVTSIHPDFDARVWRHAAGLAEKGFEVHLVCPWSVKGGSVIEGVTVHPFRRVNSRLARPFLIPVRIFRAMLRLPKGVDVVHFHDIDVLPYMAGLSLLKPVVYDVHENYPDEMLVRTYRFLPDWSRPLLFHLVRLVQWAFASVIRNVVLVVPDQRKDFWGRHFRIAQMWNYASRSLSRDRLADYQSRGPVVAFTGSQYLENGSLLVLDIADATRKLVPNVRFHVSDRFHGAMAFRDEFLRKRKALGLDATVVMHENVPARDMMMELNKARIGIIPSLPAPKMLKAMPVKLFEYMAAGLPIVTFDLPYPAGIVTTAKCGVVVRPGDVDAFAIAVADYLTDRDLAWRHGVNGATRFEAQFNWEAQLDSIVDFYHVICGGKQSTSKYV